MEESRLVGRVAPGAGPAGWPGEAAGHLPPPQLSSHNLQQTLGFSTSEKPVTRIVLTISLYDQTSFVTEELSLVGFRVKQIGEL